MNTHTKFLYFMVLLAIPIHIKSAALLDDAAAIGGDATKVAGGAEKEEKEGGMMKDMAMMVGVQTGASIADQLVSSELQQVAQGIAQDQTNMNIATKSFTQNIQLAQQAQLKNMTNLFSAAQQQVEKLMSQQTTLMQQLENYMDRIMSMQMPVPYYLTDPAQFDTLFANATMYTPQGPVWKNIYQIGNWQYDETSNSFWQMHNTAINTKKDNAYQNAIFTEWVTRQPYEISGSVTIYQTSYPFFVGIMFNKARWVSGDSYGVQNYRTIGIYGQSNTQIECCFAQQTVPPTPKGSTTTPAPSYPLDQILAGNAAQLPLTIPANSFSAPQASGTAILPVPLVINFKIQPQPNNVLYKIWLATDKAPTTYQKVLNTPPAKSNKLTTFTIAGKISDQNYTYSMANSSNIFLYHGIGFISAGAIAQFSLTGPQELVFTADNIKTFTAQANAYVQQQLSAKK